jgi:flagellar FliL protein
MAEEEKNEAEEVAEEGEEEDGEPKKKGGSKLIIIILIALVLIGGAGGGAFFFMNQEDAEDEVVVEGPSAEEVQIQEIAFYEVPNIVVNLAGSNGIARYLKIKLTLELATELDIPRLEKLMPRIIDDFQVYLRQLRVEDLQGSAGIYRLKEALLMRANQSAAPVEIQNILFTEMLIQ